MLRIPARAWVLALLSGGLQIIIFPKINFFVLCWIALVPLLYALLRGRGGEGELLDSEGRSLRPFTLKQGFLIGWVCGIVWYFGTCYWIYAVMNGYGHLDPPVAFLVLTAYCLIMAMHQAVFAMLVVFLVRRSTAGNRWPLMLAPFFWVALELFRDRVIGVPWQPLGGAQVDNVPFARIAEITGVYGLSFAIVLVNCAFTAALLLFGRRRVNLLISATAAAIALQIGIFAQPAPVPANRQAVLVQENIPLDLAWTSQFYDQTLAELRFISTTTMPPNPVEHPSLIVWPESPAPFLANDLTFRAWMAGLAQSTKAALVIGSVDIADTKDAEGRSQLYDSALIVTSQGNVLGRYDKIHLVPFGEYIPFRNLLSFASKLTREVGNFLRGTDRSVWNLGGEKVGVFICYESIFPDEVREFAANGAQVFVNITDDLWFGESDAPFQHMQMTRMRAIENHRWVLLSGNSGITGSIDPFGRLVKKAERNVRTAIVVPYAVESTSTFYSRNGDVFAWICVVISCLAIFVPRIRISPRTMIEARPT